MFIPKNSPLWSASYKENETTDWSVCCTKGLLYLRPYSTKSDTAYVWKDVKVQKVKSGAFRLYINLSACTEFERFPKKFSIEGTTIVWGKLVAWVGELLE